MDDQQLKDTFNLWWPDLEEILNNLPGPEIDQTPERNEKEILEEILERVRSIGRSKKKLVLVNPEKSKDLNEYTSNWFESSDINDLNDLRSQHYYPRSFFKDIHEIIDEKSEKSEENLEEK